MIKRGTCLLRFFKLDGDIVALGALNKGSAEAFLVVRDPAILLAIVWLLLCKELLLVDGKIDEIGISLKRIHDDDRFSFFCCEKREWTERLFNTEYPVQKLALDRRLKKHNENAFIRKING